MTLREEVLNEVTMVSQKDKVAVEVVFKALINYFNSIGEAEAANVFRNMENRSTGARIRYMRKMAEMIKQYKDF